MLLATFTALLPMISKREKAHKEQMKHGLLLLVILNRRHFGRAFQVGVINQRNCKLKYTRTNQQLYMSKHRKKIDFAGLNDSLVRSLANDLKLGTISTKLATDETKHFPVDDMTPCERREMLTRFVASHPEAEKQVAKLILKRLGLKKSTFWGTNNLDGATIMSDIVEDSESSELASPIRLHHTHARMRIFCRICHQYLGYLRTLGYPYLQVRRWDSWSM